MRTLMFVISLLVMGAGVEAREWRDIRNEADRDLPPRMQYYNKLKGKPKLLPWETDDPESLNVRLVGKWGRGPAASVTGRDTLVFLGLGSEVAIFNARDGSNPRIINEIQCRYIVDRVILKDNLLYAVLQGGIEVFDITDPARAFRVKYLPISVVDMCIRDTLAYTIDADSFKVYRIVSPESLARVGACADSGYYITVDQGFAYLCDRWGLYVIDATSPTSPHRASSLGGSGGLRAVLVEDGYCYYTLDLPSPAFVVADVSDPYHPADVGRLSGIAGWDIYKLDFFVYMPGYQIVDVSQVNSPAIIGSTSCGGYGVWTRSPYSYSFVAAGSDGLGVIGIADPVHPFLDTMTANAHNSDDISIDRGIAYVANDYGGLKLIDLSNIAAPQEVGSYDSAGRSPQAHGVAARDSFAHLLTWEWGPTAYRTIDVTDPSRPVFAGACYTGIASAIVIRDSLAYVAANYHLDIFSIANPRAPRRVGSCALPDDSYGLSLEDSFAYVANQYAGLQIINIVHPDDPVVVGSFSMPGWTNGVFVRDSLVYVASFDIGTRIVNIKDPQNPFEMGSLSTGASYDVSVLGDYAYIGCNGLRVADVSDPAHPELVGYYLSPGGIRRVVADSQYVYGACLGAGVVILERAQAGVTETGVPDHITGLELLPNPEFERLVLPTDLARQGSVDLTISDATGRQVFFARLNPEEHAAGVVNLPGRLPKGVCFVTLRSGLRVYSTKGIRLTERR